MEELLQAFLNTSDVPNARKILSFCKERQINYLGNLFASYFRSIFPSSLEIISESGFFEFQTGSVEKAFDTIDTISRFTDLWKVQVSMFPSIENRYISYDRDLVLSLTKKPTRPFPLVTFTITTCKRYDLFEMTINSFLNCCLDLNKIDRWFCVDDNSSEEDRAKMKEKYPFFDFYFKNSSEKGHPRSMNIIRNQVTTPYIFHLEDDWKFFRKANYVSDCLYVVSQDPNIGQCLINKNYAELFSDNELVGGTTVFAPLNQIYTIHQHCATNEEYEEFNKMYEGRKNCAYWPHFSFRPSLLKKSILDKIGEFDEKISHFELAYSMMYKNSGFISAFLPGVFCVHTGRLTSQRNDASKANAYTLNKEKQFDKTFQIPPIFVVNLDRRTDRMKKLKIPVEYTRYPAIDGLRITPTERLQRIFDGNDYDMRAGMVGCALSHLSLWIDLVYSDKEFFCILEDDVETTPGFAEKLEHVLKNLEKDWDVCFLGHHLWKKYKTEDYYDKNRYPDLEKWDKATSLKFSMGGTGGYLISKKGALSLLEFIDKTGMTNGIDTMIQKAGDLVNLYYCRPHLIYTECATEEKKVDSDIQNEFLSLTIPLEQRIEKERKLYPDSVFTDREEDAIKHLQERKKTPLIYRGKNTKLIQGLSKLPNYTIGDAVFMASSITERGRLKKNGRFDISELILGSMHPPASSPTPPSEKINTSIISLGEMTYIDEYLKEYGNDKTEYPFDKLDRCSLETACYLIEICMGLSDPELEDFVVDFCSPEKNTTYTQEYNGKKVVENKRYRIVFPHDDTNTIVATYISRFQNLRNAIRSKNKIVFVHACRFYTDYSADIQHLTEFLKEHNPKVSFLTINGQKENTPECTSVSIPFPEKFRNTDWTPEKVGYDQMHFKPELAKPIRNFLQKSCL